MALLFAKNNSLSAVTALPAAVSGGGLNLISTQTASSSASIEFTSGIDSTYKEYVFKFINIHPATDGAKFQFQTDTGTNTNYNQTITSTTFYAFHSESGSSSSLSYDGSYDQAQGTSFQDLIFYQGNDADQQCSGTLQIFNPSSSVFVKHFIARGVRASANDQISDEYTAGYINTTAALTRVRFKFSSGNIDSGTIKLYGVT
jgi:hypothetical protein